MKYIVAVSGGVDSVVLLDMLVRAAEGTSEASFSGRDEFWNSFPKRSGGQYPPEKIELIVAHFDHGIRPESDADARFVWELARRYGLSFEVRREELGEHASEAFARERRYIFLRDVAEKYEATIVTAHHQDDVIETIAINLTRGTGWRGLAVFTNGSVERPLLHKTKSELYDYALQRDLEWVEDETNSSDGYLRNRLRRRLHRELRSEKRDTLLDLWDQQCRLRLAIDHEVENLPESAYSSRYFFTMLPENVSIELLERVTEGALTRPQLARLLLAIKTAPTYTKHEPGGGLCVEFGIRSFTMKPLSKLV